MLRIRLRRTGARKKPQYRLVVAESTSPRDGRYIEIIGTYNPLTNPSTINVDQDRAKHWLSVGASPSDRVHKILAGQGLMEPPKFATPRTTTEDDASSADGGSDASVVVADEVTASPALALAAEEAGASGPIPNLGEESGAVDETNADTLATTAGVGTTVTVTPEAPDAASEAV